jgi:hypothetical protein
VFERVGGVWSQTAKLVASDGAGADSFGLSVSISGDTILVGALRDDDLGDQSGSACVFERSVGVWTQTAKLLPDDGDAGDLFGNAVALSGDVAVIGASHDDDPGVDSGSAYVFTRGASGGWSQTKKVQAGDGSAGAKFASHVATNGTTILVGLRCKRGHSAPLAGTSEPLVLARGGSRPAARHRAARVP